MEELNSLEDVFLEQLADLRSAEQQLVAALPKVAAAASSDELRSAFEEHLEQTRGHVGRLEKIIADLPATAPGEHCEGMEGLIREGEQLLAKPGDAGSKDAALIAAAQRIEHYEIAAYGTARTLADEFGYEDAKDLLAKTLDEEADADERLTRIATGGLLSAGVNRAATG